MYKKLLITALLCCSFISGYGQLAGGYTINASIAASATNYQTFESAVSDLQSGTRADGGPVNGPGISAAVTFSVASGTYNLSSTLVIRSITGSSYANSIVFVSATGNPADVTVQYTSPSVANDAVIRIKGADYLKFSSMTILNNSTNFNYSKGFHIDTATTLANTADSIVIYNCNIRTAWYVTANTAAINAVNNPKNLKIIKNNIARTFGISYVGRSVTPYPTGLQIDSNTFTIVSNDAFKPIFVQYAEAPLIRYNNISKTGCCADIQMELRNIKGAMVVAYNRFNSAGGSNGLLLDNINNAAPDVTYAQVYNNMISIGSANVYGIRINNSRYLRVYHNSVFCTNGTSITSKALETNNTSSLSTKVSILNNIFYANNQYGIYVNGSTLSLARSMIDTLDYNVYFNNGVAPIAYLFGTDYTDFNAFKSQVYASGLGNDAHSYQKNPEYISNTDLHVSGNNCFVGLSGLLTSDYDGNSFLSLPMIGCDEPSRVNNNIGVSKILLPTSPFSTGLQDVKFVVQNYGLNTVTSFNTGYNLNNAGVQTKAYSVSLATCDTMHADFYGAQQINVPAGYNVHKCFTYSPNGVTDVNITNDTFTQSICQPLSGTYTIDPAGSGITNFTSFTLAAQSLNNCGVSGPVVFDVTSGTYNEQVTLLNITGASATNSITFQSASGNPSDVVLTYNANATNNFTLRFVLSNFIKMRNLTVAATNPSYGVAMLLSSGASNDSFYNVIFNGVTTTSTSTNLAVVSCPGGISNFIYFDSCRFNSGSYGTYFVSTSSIPSSSNLTIYNSDFNNQYAYGSYCQYLAGLKLLKNRYVTNSALTTHVAMYNYWIMVPADANRPIITGNRISGAVGGSGILNQYIGVNSTITTARRALIANNMIQIGSGANASYGINNQNDYGSDYIHNSVNIGTSSTASTSAAANFASTAGGVTVLNNSFSAYNGAPAVRIVNTSGYPTFNYNNLYTTGTNLAYLNTTAYTTLLSWQTASSRDANSINVLPFYTTNTDLHTNQAAMDNAGTTSALVTTDYDGQVRCPGGGCPGAGSNPDIGADEFVPVALDAGIIAVESPTLVCPGAGSSNILVTLKNFGSTTLTATDIEWSVNGVVQTPFSWTGSLTQGQSASAVNIGSFSFLLPTNTIKVWTANPNGGTDGNNTNDTISSAPGASLSGTYTIGGVTPDYANFTAAVAALSTYGVCGPVTFLVRQGTYNEKITINAITGSSATNFVLFRNDPANVSPAILTTAGNTGTSDNHTVLLNGCSFIGFKYLTISNTSTGTFKSVFRFTGTQDSILLVSNIISTNTTTSTSVNEAVINHGTGLANMINRFTLDSNTISNGSMGVYMYGNTNITPFESRNKVRFNTITGSSYYGVYSHFQNRAMIVGNNIQMSATSNSSSIGIYLNYNDTFRVDKNYVNNFGQYGVYMANANYQGGTGTAWSYFTNNAVGGTSTNSSPYGVYIQPLNNRYIGIYHNSISATSSNYAFFMQQTNINHYSNIDVKNNSFANFGTGQAAYFYFNTGTPFSINYNNYYSTATTYYTLGTSSYNAAQPNGGSPTYNANSKNGNPNYTNNYTNLTPKPNASQLSNAGTNLATVADDIDGVSRPLAPSAVVDIGAFEYNVADPNIGVTAVLQPIAPLTPGSQNIIVTIKNYSPSTTITTANINYRVGYNGAVQTTAWSGTLAAGATTNYTFTGAQQYNFTGIRDTIYAWTDSPNGTIDQYAGDDTFTKRVCSPLAGNYTIDAANPTVGTNFNSFTHAVNDCIDCGISAAVVFDVVASSGPYIEQINIPTITGSSSVNTVTFNGNNNTLTFSPTFLSPALIALSGADYFRFNNLNIVGTSSNNGVGVHLSGASDFNRFDSCVINLSAVTSLLNNTAGIAISSSLTSLTSSGVNGYNNVFNANQILGGATGGPYYGIVNVPSTGSTVQSRNEFTNNIIRDFSIFGYYSNSSNRNVFKGNDISRPNRTYNATIYGMYLINGNRADTIANNRIHDLLSAIPTSTSGMYGIYFATPNSATAERITVYNNLLYNFISNGLACGIYGSVDNNIDYYHNTISLDYTGSTASGANYTYGYYRNGTINNPNTINFRNNIITITRGGTANKWGIYLNTNSTQYSINYNNIYVSATNGYTGYYSATNYVTLANWQTANSNAYDQNSVAIDPLYDVDYKPTVGSLNNLGTPVAFVTKDIAGETRDVSTPDMGAFEFDAVLVVRSTVGDYNGTCLNLSGSSWINLVDGSGEIVASINPNGNNLGNTCWGVRIVNSTDGITRKTNMPTSGSGYGYWLDRNFYITPTTQPSSPVSIRFFILNTELADLRDQAAFDMVNSETDSLQFFMDSVILTKHSGYVNDLEPTDSLLAAYISGVVPSSVTGYGTNAVCMELSVSGFSEFTPTFNPSSPLVPLPITFLSFEAVSHDNDALLEWRVANASNMLHFVVERSFDGINFTDIATVSSPQSIINKVFYYTDFGIGEMGYTSVVYRIRAVMVNEEETTIPRIVYFENGLTINVFPNPFSDEVKVSVNSDMVACNCFTITLSDITGKVIKTATLERSNGDVTLHPDKHLAPGIYLLRVDNGSQTRSFKLIRQ